jgi:hypothetical protein
MIWFACKQCGRVHGRPENSIGAMIFCDCGQGLTVPWENTAPEPAGGAEAVSLPRPEPLTFGAQPEREPYREPEPAPRRARRGRIEPDPAVCFNHETVPKREVCADCGLSFCAECITLFRGQMLCGPCKNYLVKKLQRAPRISGWALTSMATALLTAPGLFCLMPIGRSMGGASWLTLLALVPHGLAIALGMLALRQADSDPRLGGRSQAIAGIVIASLAAVVTVVMTVTIQRWGA